MMMLNELIVKMEETAAQRDGFTSIRDNHYCKCGEEILPKANFCIWCGRPILEAYYRLKTELNEAIAAIADAPPTKPDLADLSNFAEEDTFDVPLGEPYEPDNDDPDWGNDRV